MDGKFLSNLRFADDIVIFSRSTTEAEVMLEELNERKIGLRINRKKTQFMKNAWCNGGHVNIDGSPLSKRNLACLGRSMNMENDMKKELVRRRRTAWSAYGSIKQSTDQLLDSDLRAHLFDSTVLPAVCYAAETWLDTSATAKSLKLHTELSRDVFISSTCFPNIEPVFTAPI